MLQRRQQAVAPASASASPAARAAADASLLALLGRTQRAIDVRGAALRSARGSPPACDGAQSSLRRPRHAAPPCRRLAARLAGRGGLRSSSRAGGDGSCGGRAHARRGRTVEHAQRGQQRDHMLLVAHLVANRVGLTVAAQCDLSQLCEAAQVLRLAEEGDAVPGRLEALERPAVALHQPGEALQLVVTEQQPAQLWRSGEAIDHANQVAREVKNLELAQRVQPLHALQPVGRQVEIGEAGLPLEVLPDLAHAIGV